MTADRSRRASFRSAFLAAVLVAASATPALAEVHNPARAEQLFKLGKELMDKGQLEEACKAFQASQQADPSVGALLNLALCHEKKGHTATAWAVYKEAASLAANRGEAERSAGAKELADKLEKQLSRLTVKVSDRHDGMTVRVDEQELPPVSYGVALPVDPGEHRVDASAVGYETWSATVSVEDHADSRSVTVPPLAKGGGHRRGQLIAGAVIGGVGVLGLIGGIIEGVSAIGIRSYLKEHCAGTPDGKFDCPSPTDPDPATTQKKLDSFKPTANISTALFVAGGLLTATGVVVMLTAPKQPTEPASALRISPVIAPGAGGVMLTASF